MSYVYIIWKSHVIFENNFAILNSSPVVSEPLDYH